MKQKKISSQTRTYPFNKTLFVKKYERPSLFIRIINLVIGIRQAFQNFLHPRIDLYNHYPLVHIWGNAQDSNLYTHDDICIIYNVKDKMYYLKINTAICADTEGFCEYLEYTLQCFTSFMVSLGFDIEYPKKIFREEPKIELKAPSLEELYTEYNLFVNAFFALYALPEEIEDERNEDEDEEDEKYNL